MTNLSDHAKTVLKARYLREGEDWEKLCRRVANAIAQNEKQPNKWEEKFGEIIYNLEFIPGGRQLRNAGKLRGQLGNCFSLPFEDSTHSIGLFIMNALILWSKGGGLGMLMNLRPKGAPIQDEGFSSGMVSFLKAIDACAETIEIGGDFRAACLGICKVSHPELLGYVDAKLKHGMLSHFNLSVAITQEFLEAVERKNSWKFSFAGQDYGEIEAEKLWEKIVNNMITSAEPGLINWDNFSKNNSYYFAPINGANACAELPLEDYGICNLGSLVLPSFLSGKQTNWKKLEEVIRIAIRYLDNVIDVNHYLLPEIEIAAKNARRCGHGNMGYADFLFAKEIEYGSSKAISETERLYKFIRDIAYHESMMLAQEKGAFPKFDKTDFGKASFVRKLPHSLRMDIKKYGIRNCTLLAIPPTGTTSLIADVTSGIEPLFAKAYTRRMRLSKGKIDERYYIHPIYLDCLINNKEIPPWFVDAHDIKPEAHFETQIAIGKYVDSGISKTINMPKGTTADDLSHLLLEYIWDMKSVTVYVDGSRKEQILYPMDEKEVRKLMKEKDLASFTKVLEGDVECRSGVCEL